MKEYWLRGKPIEDLTQEEIDSLTWEEISTLFIAEETSCRECDYEYSEADVARWRAVEAAGVPWACPHCGMPSQPQVRFVHHMQELVSAWVDLVENFRWLGNMRPEMRPLLEVQITKAQAQVEARLGPEMTQWLRLALDSVPIEGSGE